VGPGNIGVAPQWRANVVYKAHAAYILEKDRTPALARPAPVPA